jgi:hypothetical protein
MEKCDLLKAKLIAAMVLVPFATVAQAVSVSDDFEGPGPWQTNQWGTGTSVSVVSGEEYRSADTALKLSVDNGATNNDGARIAYDLNESLADTVAGTVSFWAKITKSTQQNLAPYLGLVLDTDGNSSADKWVLQMTPTAVANSWYENTTDASTQVHVAGGGAPSAFTIGNGGGLLGDLLSVSVGSGTYADANVLQVRVYAGIWNGTNGDFEAYVDDINVQPAGAVVPVPGAGLAGLGLIGLIAAKRRRHAG